MRCSRSMTARCPVSMLESWLPTAWRSWLSCAVATETAAFNSPSLRSSPPPARLVSFGSCAAFRLSSCEWVTLPGSLSVLASGPTVKPFRCAALSKHQIGAINIAGYRDAKAAGRRGWCDDPLRAPTRREGSRDCRAAEMRDELADRIASAPRRRARTAPEDIQLMRFSQEVAKRFTRCTP